MEILCASICLLCRPDRYPGQSRRKRNQRKSGDRHPYIRCFVPGVGNCLFQRTPERSQGTKQSQLGISDFVGIGHGAFMDILLQGAGNWRRVESCSHRQVKHRVCNDIGFRFPERTDGHQNHCWRSIHPYRNNGADMVIGI